jgi:hypothetical protein
MGIFDCFSCTAVNVGFATATAVAAAEFVVDDLHSFSFEHSHCLLNLYAFA